MTTNTHFSLVRRFVPLIAAASCCFPAAISLAVLASAASAAASTATAAPAGAAPSLTLAPGSRLWLEGDSTLHPYKTQATQVDATAELDAAFPAGAAAARAAITGGGMKNLSVSVPVASLKSGESGLDKNLEKALKQDAAPVIRFTVVDYKTEEAKDGGLVVKARGRLAMAGVEKEVFVEATCRFAPGVVEVTGAKDLLMSDFGIKPPVLMFGAIKTADKVVVHFDLKLNPPDATSASKQ
jgi:polyisoprenoid-binding protein YceI